MQQFSKCDLYHMSRALTLAELGRYTVGANPMVACVIARDDKVIAEAYHRRTGEAHAEPLALAQAGDNARDSTVYVTLEPCVHQGRTPPCVPALIEARVERVVIAMRDPNPLVHGQGISELETAGIQVECGLFSDQARDLNRGFVSRIERGRPWLRLKSAISLDGHIALSSGKSAWISSEEARRDVQFWRAQSSALLTSSRTVQADDPQLNVRVTAEDLGIEGTVRQPLRVVLDSRLSTSPEAKIYNSDAKTVVVCCESIATEAKRNEFERRNVEVLSLPTTKSRIPLLKLLETLTEQYELNEVQVEAGGVLFGAIIEAGLCDELLLYIAPCLLGAESKKLAEFDDIIQKMEERINFGYKEVMNIGKDVRVLLEPCPR